MERSGLRWREAIASGGERSQVKGSDGRWRKAVSGGGEQSLVQAIQIEYTMGNLILYAERCFAVLHLFRSLCVIASEEGTPVIRKRTGMLSRKVLHQNWVPINIHRIFKSENNVIL